MNIKLLKLCISENIKLIKKNLSIQNFGNVSIKIDNDYFAIKPSGVDLSKIKYKDIPVIDIKKGLQIYGNLAPSTDMLTHLVIYKNFSRVNSISHTHSKFATSWAQTSKNIPIYGTTHADFCKKEIPCLRYLSKKNVLKNYELNTGKLIVKFFKQKKLDINHFPGILVAGHGSFAWGNSITSSTKNIEIIEYIAELAYYSNMLKVKKSIPKYIVEKHFNRKNGIAAYYGQKK